MVDVTVRGAGIFGLSIAWACLKLGASVRVIDPNGVGAGASGGLVGALAPHVPENWNEKKAFQFESLIMAEAFWIEVSDVAGEDAGYGRLGRCQPLMDDRSVALARERAESAKALWQGKFDWRVTRTPEGIETPSPTGFYVMDTLSARVHPRRATQALAKALTARGVEVATEGDTEGREVWATGVHDLHEMTAQSQKVLGNGVKGQAALLEFAAKDAPQLFAGALHLIPHADGTLAIGSTSERDYDNGHNTDEQLDDVIDRARALCPAIADAPVIERWAGLRPRSRSRAPVLGAHPLRAGAFIANGGFKIGFGMAPKVGAVMAALMLEGRDDIPESFRP